MRFRYNAGSPQAPPESSSSSVAAGPTAPAAAAAVVAATDVVDAAAADLLDMDAGGIYVDPSEVLATHVFNERPFCSFQGHTSDVLDMCWSKNYFLLTSSMDKTVRLWHITRRECLCCFQHIDFVTALAFHPRNDQVWQMKKRGGKK